MRFARVVPLAWCMFALASLAQASAFTHASRSGAATVAVGAGGAQCGSDFLTQSSVQTIVADNSVSCNVDGSIHVENSYYRVYDLSIYPVGFNLCEIEIGVQSATSVSGTQPLTLNLYAHSGAAFPAGTSSLIGSTPLSVPDQAGTLFNVPVSTYVPAGAELVIEVFAPDGQAAGNSFFIGSNAASETFASYLRAPNCGVPQPATTASSGFPNMHVVLNARGDPAIGLPQVSAVPALADFGVVEIGATETRSVELINSGSAELVISSIASPPQPFNLVADGCSGRRLQPGLVCQMVFAFSPLSGEPVSTSLQVISNAASSTIDLRGSGLLPMPLPAPGLPWMIGLVLAIVTLARVRLDASR